MDTILSRFPSSEELRERSYRHRGKIAGFFSGSLGMWVLTTFLVVAITGVPFGGDRPHPERFIVYPNF